MYATYEIWMLCAFGATSRSASNIEEMKMTERKMNSMISITCGGNTPNTCTRHTASRTDQQKKEERKNNENMEKKMKKKNITSQQCDDLRVLAIFIHCSGASQFFASTKLIIDFRNSQFHRTRPHKSCGCFSFKIIVIFLGVLAIVVCECIQFLVQIHTTCMPRVWKCCNCKQKSSSRRWFCGNIKMWQMFCGVSCRLTRASSILLNSDWFVVCVCVSASFIETSVVVQFLATTAFYNSFANRWHDNCAAKK